MKTNQSQHTPEPWKSVNSHKSGFRDIATFEETGSANRHKFIAVVFPSDTAFADGERIVECVNAMAGIESPAKAAEIYKDYEVAGKTDLQRLIPKTKAVVDACRSALAEINQCQVSNFKHPTLAAASETLRNAIDGFYK